MNPMRLLILPFLIGGLLLSACTVTPTLQPLDGTSWNLATLNGQPPVAGTWATLSFEAGRAAGSDGCNNYSTGYTINGNEFRIDERIASTKRACAEPIMNQADTFIAALLQAAAYTSEGYNLTLYGTSGGQLAEFTLKRTGLAGTSWNVTGYNNGAHAVVSTVAGSNLTATFNKDGTLTGSAGCNNYTATYEIAERNITIGRVATTRRLCAEPEGVMEQEGRFVQALQTAATFRLDGSRLELRNADGALVVTFVESR